MMMLTTIISSLGINNTFFIQFFIFIAVFVIVNKLVFSPFGKVFKEREKRLIGSKTNAGDLLIQAQKKAVEYEDQLHISKEAARTMFDEIKSETIAEKEKILMDTKVNTSKIIHEQKQKIKTEIDTIHDALMKQIPEFSNLIIQKILGRTV